MSVMLCPHCGANREGMNDQQPCWRCKKLPYSTVTQPVHSAAGYNPYPTASPYPYSTALQEQRHSNSCLVIGSIVLAMTLLMGGVAFLVMTLLNNDDNTPATPDGVALVQNTPTAETDPPIVLDAPTNGGELGGVIPATAPQVAIGPNAETSVAQQAAFASATFTPLPSSTPAPTLTPAAGLAPASINCPGSPPTRLSLNLQAAVINNPSVRMRSDPGLEAQVLQEVAYGTAMTITGGPACVSNLLWWQVQLNSTVGWIAEGQAGAYYLEPR
ncbi:MAG: SH3 domain-containing protein [Chloroflexi bacterium]|nr:SH3 domain-containing protein [Chloroflexota bacterium]